MNIALLFGGLNRGGAENLSLQVIKNSVNRNLNYCCFHRKGGELLAEFSNTGIDIINLYPKYPFDLIYIFRLRRILIHRKIRIVHTHQVSDSFIAIISTIFTNIKTIQTFHGHGMNYSQLMKFLRWFAFRFNTKNIFVSNTQLQYYKEKFRINTNKVSVVYNGINSSNFDKPHSNKLREDLKIRKESLLTGTVGNFTNGRDQMTICRFLLLLARSNVEFKHVFIGARSKTEPWYFDNCVSFCKENQLEDQVLFLGSRTDVPILLSQLDAFIYSTNHDTFSLALIEAIISGIPVFANDWRVFIELTEKGKLATIFKSKNEMDLLDKFLNFIDNRAKFVQKATDASKDVRQKYSIETHINSIEKEYINLLE